MFVKVQFNKSTLWNYLYYSGLDITDKRAIRRVTTLHTYHLIYLVFIFGDL